MKLSIKIYKAKKALCYSSMKLLGAAIPSLQNKCFSPFVIISRSRSGSNLLKNYLNTASSVECFGEFFRDADRVGWDRPGLIQSSKSLEHYLNDPVEFLEEDFLKWQPKHVHHAGFKLFYYHSRNDKRAQLWDFLESSEQIPVIHLWRRNLLKVVVSKRVAVESGVWLDHGKSAVNVKPLVIDPEEIINEIKSTIRWEDLIRGKFKGKRFMDLCFEDLLKNPDSQLENISKHLKFNKTLKAISGTVPQQKKPMSEQLKNYDEIIAICKLDEEVKMRIK